MWKIGNKKNYGNADAVWALALQEGTAGARLDIYWNIFEFYID